MWFTVCSNWLRSSYNISYANVVFFSQESELRNRSFCFEDTDSFLSSSVSSLQKPLRKVIRWVTEYIITSNLIELSAVNYTQLSWTKRKTSSAPIFNHNLITRQPNSFTSPNPIKCCSQRNANNPWPACISTFTFEEENASFHRNKFNSDAP